MTFNWPNYFGDKCPPPPHTAIEGTYYKVVTNTNKSDPDHYKSHYLTGEMEKLEQTEPCSRRSLSVMASYDEALRLSTMYPRKGKFIARLGLKNGCGVVHHTPVKIWKSHHDWWRPIDVDPVTCCIEITERAA